MRTGAPVLIATNAARALAQSARRAGFVPLVADRFGDLDTLAAAAAYRPIAGAPLNLFEPGPLIEALAALEAEAGGPVLGLVLGAGFEAQPKLVGALGSRWRLIGCGAEAVRASKDPAGFAALCSRLGVPHPALSLTLPGDRAGWLVKATGGSGGLHVAEAAGFESLPGDHYVQRMAAGAPLSLLAVASGAGLRCVGFSRQWTSPGAGAPHRYGGAVGPVRLPQALATTLTGEASRLAAALGLVGLVAFDWLVDADSHVLLEVNPRPGATLDVFDDPGGALFAAHVAAGLGEDVAGPAASASTRAAAIAWADGGDVVVPALDWPDWAHDRSPPGTAIVQGGPLCTVTAQAGTPEEAEALALLRVAQITRMLYPAPESQDKGPWHKVV
jgi:predicted ATP-grasp superfamily ATP-dependent carboligase